MLLGGGADSSRMAGTRLTKMEVRRRTQGLYWSLWGPVLREGMCTGQGHEVKGGFYV